MMRDGPWASVTIVTLAVFLPIAGGCTSNAYVIPHDELTRLAAAPPAERGTHVHVVQDLGEKHEAGSAHVNGSWSFGGGGGKADVVVVVAIIVIVAVVVAVGLVSSEGVRFDGYVAMSPDQPVHLRDTAGRSTTMPVEALTPAWVDATVEAKVLDDEGSGLGRGDRAPLDRRGGVFRLDSGSIAFDVAGMTAVGPAMHVQAGYFLTRQLGFVVSLGLAGAGYGQGLVPRHALALELQALPVALGPVHLGLYGSGGMALTEILIGQTPTYVSGPSVGGGLLAELDLTSRMALTFRAGGDMSSLDGRWTPAGLLNAGVAVY